MLNFFLRSERREGSDERSAERVHQDFRELRGVCAIDRLVQEGRGEDLIRQVMALCFQKCYLEEILNVLKL